MNKPNQISGNKWQRIRRLFLGLAAGDSLGSTVEFMSESQVRAAYQKYSNQGWPLFQVGGGPFGWSPGDPTDDTDMAYALIKAFTATNGQDIPVVNITKYFVEWYYTRPRDIGGTTRRTLSRMAKENVDPYDIGYAEWQLNPDNEANGSLMRNGVIAGMADDLDQAFEYTMRHSVITHFGHMPTICCLLQTWLIWSYLVGDQPLGETDWIGQGRAVIESWTEKNINDDISTRWLNWAKGQERQRWDESWSKLFAINWRVNAYNPYGDTSMQGWVLRTLRVAIWGQCVSLMNDHEPIEILPKWWPESIRNLKGPDRLAWIAMIGADSDTYGATSGAMIMSCHQKLRLSISENLKIMRKLNIRYAEK